MLGSQLSSDPEITKDLDVYGLGKMRTLDAYQQYSGIDFANQCIADFAHQGIFISEVANNRAITRKSRMDDSIFVQIASYRDEECQYTVKDLFEKAKNPERVFVGICWQFNPAEDESCFQISTRPYQVRMLPYYWHTSQGVCFARHLAQQLWQGEQYTLQIDSHTRFVQNWDALLIEELAVCNSAKPVLSCVPAAYTPPNNLRDDVYAAIRCASHFAEEGNLKFRNGYLKHSSDKPVNAAFIASNFIFAQSELFVEVPYDPYMSFDQEETAYSARLYTYGWDIFGTRKLLLFHFSSKDRNASLHQRQIDDLNCRDTNRACFLKARGVDRFNHLMGLQLSDNPEVTRDLKKFSLGQARTLSEFEAYAGIDFRSKTVSECAAQCLFSDDIAHNAASSVGLTGSTVSGEAMTFTRSQDNHQPRKVFESKQAIIFDDFLPPDVYERVQQFALKTDYEYINTKGKISRAWHVHDGFPMRSTLNGFYYAKDVTKKPAGDHVYPTGTDMDLFLDKLISIQPRVAHLTGKEGVDGWMHVSSTCWVYPHGAALSMHDDGSGVYTGAYVYFLNPAWRPHWGGLLIMMDEEANRRVFDHRSKIDQIDYYKKKFFHVNGLDEMLVDYGFGKCIFPKGNRIVFIANDAYHMVTRVNETAGDNVRMSIAGFFNRKK